jgi:membrane protein DedA with SNARE-associated domain
MRWLRFSAFAAAAASAWASYAALLGYLGGRAFENNPLWGILVGFGVAALTFLLVEAARRTRARRRRPGEVKTVVRKSAPPDRRAAA